MVLLSNFTSGCFLNDRIVSENRNDCSDYQDAISSILTTSPYTESLSKPQRKQQTFRLLSYSQEITAVQEVLLPENISKVWGLCCESPLTEGF